MWDIIEGAGWPIWPLIFSSIIALAIIIERLWALRAQVIALKNLLNEGDLLITLSGSGDSENVVKATNVANEMKVNTLTICGYDGGRLKKISKKSVWIKSNDMQLCEDAQTVFGHIVMKSLCSAKIFV